MSTVPGEESWRDAGLVEPRPAEPVEPLPAEPVEPLPAEPVEAPVDPVGPAALRRGAGRRQDGTVAGADPGGGMSTLTGAIDWDEGEDREVDREAPPTARPVEAPVDEEDFLPPDPRPDRLGEADEADVAEQAAEVPDDEGDDPR